MEQIDSRDRPVAIEITDEMVKAGAEFVLEFALNSAISVNMAEVSEHDALCDWADQISKGVLVSSLIALKSI